MSSLISDDKKKLLNFARYSMENSVKSDWLSNQERAELSEDLLVESGCFVTLTIMEKLRGCIGYIEGIMPLYKAVIENGYNAAYSDPRFSKVTKEEFSLINIEISVLSKPVPMLYNSMDELLNKLNPGVDGVILKSGCRSSTFLPQVWEQLPDKEEFLNHLSLKAGLSKEEWKQGKVEISIYNVEHFDEKLFS